MCVYMYIYIYIYIYTHTLYIISPVKRLIESKIKVFVYIISVCALYIHDVYIISVCALYIHDVYIISVCALYIHDVYIISVCALYIHDVYIISVCALYIHDVYINAHTCMYIFQKNMLCLYIKYYFQNIYCMCVCVFRYTIHTQTLCEQKLILDAINHLKALIYIYIYIYIHTHTHTSYLNIIIISLTCEKSCHLFRIFRITDKNSFWLFYILYILIF